MFMLAEWDELYPSGGLTWEEFNSDTHLLEKAFDMSFGLRLHYLLDRIAEGKSELNDIDIYLAAEREKYPPTVCLMNFTSNHDVNSWDGTEYERLGPLALPFAVLTALLPGMPMLYSGQKPAWTAGYPSLIKTPSSGAPTPSRTFTPGSCNSKSATRPCAMATPAAASSASPGRPACTGSSVEKEGSAVVVLINTTAEALVLPGQKTPITPQKGLFDMFSGAQCTLAQPAARTVPAHGWRVLRTRD
ncbi:MAG: hypothetical protein WKG07_43480 [Hymenobacter sp.]